MSFNIYSLYYGVFLYIFQWNEFGGKVHLNEGETIVEGAIREVKEECGLTVTNEDLKYMGNNNTVNEQVEKLAKVAKETGVGVVCSGHEAKIVRKIVGQNLLIFTPGIRMAEDGKNDQKRVCTPIESIKNGANKIIMGRSLIKGNIKENIDKVSNSIKE